MYSLVKTQGEKSLISNTRTSNHEKFNLELISNLSGLCVGWYAGVMLLGCYVIGELGKRMLNW